MQRLRPYIFLFILLLFGANAFADGSSIQQITTHPNIEMSGSVSSDGRWLVFASDREGNFDIWVKNLSNNRIKQITTTKADEMYPSWAPDGNSIYFTSQHGDADGDIFRAYLKEYNGIPISKDIKRITYKRGFDSYATVAPDGKTEAWVSERGGQHDIYLADDFRQNFRQLTFAGATQPRWHPTRDILVFTTFRKGKDQHGDIWILNLEAAPGMRHDPASIDSLQRPLIPITRGIAADAFPAWTADGNGITFVRYDVDSDQNGRVNPGDKGRIWYVELNLGANADSTVNIADQSFNPLVVRKAWPVSSYVQNAREPQQAPNGEIIYHARLNNNTNIWSIQPDSALVKNNDFRTYINSHYPLPRDLDSYDPAAILFSAEKPAFKNKELLTLGLRESAFYIILNRTDISAHDEQNALYELAVCALLQGYKNRARQQLYRIARTDSVYYSYAQLLLTGIERIRGGQTNWDNMMRAVDRIEKQAETPETRTAARLFKADLLTRNNRYNEAIVLYQSLIDDQQTPAPAKQQSRYNLAQALLAADQKEQAIELLEPLFNDVVYTDKLAHNARTEFFKAQNQNVKSDQLEQHYRALAVRYQNTPFIHDEALLRLAHLQNSDKNYQRALETCRNIIANTIDPEAQFIAELEIADIYSRTNQDVRAIEHLDDVRQHYAAIDTAFSTTAKNNLISTLISSAEALKSFQEYASAASRYAYARELQPTLIAAHSGYIESIYRLGRINDIIDEYLELTTAHPEDNVALFGLGLAYSYRGMQKFDLYNNPAGMREDDLLKSVDILNQALSLDYNNLEAFLALGYNYEMLENYTRWKENREKNFAQKTFGLFKLPFVWMYRTLSFYNETKPPQYYESAIQQLTAAKLLNNDQDNLQLEANLALNLANNYYNLGEYGAAKAYQYYQSYLAYDSTFNNLRIEAEIKERMGHCALYLNDLPHGQTLLKRAIDLYSKLGDDLHTLLNMKRLAMLYQISGDYPNALHYFETAAQIEARKRLYPSLLKSKRSIAYQHLMLQEYDQAISYAEQALELIEKGQVKRSEAPPLYLKLAVSGIYLPVPYDLRRLGLKSTINLTTEQEEAYIYTILALGYTYTKQYDKAIDFYEKKLTMYRRQHDHDAQGVFYNNEGFIHFMRGDYNKAWKYFISAYWECYKNGYIGGHLLTLENAFHVATIIAEDEPNPDYDLNLYYRSVIHKCEYIFELTQADADLYPQMYARLHMMMAEMIMLDQQQRQHATEVDRLAGAVHRLERMPEALQHLQTALNLARQNRLPRETCLALFRLGKLAHFSNDLSMSQKNLLQARNIALREQYHDLLWEIDTHLGNVLVEIQKLNPARTASLKPLLYYNEAIHELRSSRVSEPGLTVSSLHKKYGRPFKGAITYHLSQGQYSRALELAETAKMYNFIITIEQEDVVLPDPEKQSLYETAKNIRDQVNAQASLIFQIENASASALQIQRQQAIWDSLKITENALLAEIRTFAPEIERLVKEKPINLKALQAGLPQGSGILYHMADENNSLLWCITRDSLSFRALPISDQMLRQSLDTFCQVAQQQDSEFIVDKTLEQFFAAGKNLTHLYLVPDPDFITYPWSTISQLLADPVRIYGVQPSLFDLQEFIKNKRQNGNRLFWADYRSAVLPDSQFTILSQPDEIGGLATSIHNEQVATSDVVHLHINENWNNTEPLRSLLKFRHNKTKFTAFMPLDFYQLQTNAQTWVLSFYDSSNVQQHAGSFAVLLQSLVNAGAANILVNLWPLADEQAATFYNRYYSHLRTADPMDALRQTQSELRAEGEPVSMWGAFQFYGFGGELDRSAFPRQQNYANIVKSAEQALQKQNWPQALLNFERALVSAPSESDQAKIKERIKTCAINGRNWNKVIEMELTALKQAEKSGDREKIATLCRQLAFYYKRTGNAAIANQYQNRFSRLQKELGLQVDEGNLLLETASIWQQGSNFNQAIAEIDKAKKVFAAQGQPDRLAECGNLKAQILANDLEKPVAALKELQSTPVHNIQNETKLTSRLQQLNLCTQLLLFTKADSLVSIIANEPPLPDTELWTEFNLLKIELAAQRGQAALITNFSYSSQEAQTRFRIALATSTAHLLAGDLQAANNKAYQALDLVRQLNNKRLLAFAFKQLGLIAWASQDLIAAQNYFNKALLSIDTENDEKLEYEFNMLLGFVALDTDDDATAELHGQTALTLAQTLNSPERKIKAWLILSRSVERSRRTDFAKMIADSAAANFQPNLQARGLLQLARLAVREDNPDSAAVFYKNAVTAIEKVELSPLQLLLEGYSLSRQNFYDEYTDFLINSGKNIAAWTVAQRAKNVDLNLAYRASRAHLKDNEQQWFNRYDSLQNAMRYQVAAWNESDKDSTIYKKARAVQQKLQTVTTAFQAEMPRTFSLRFSYNPSLQEIQNTLSPQEIILDYFYTENRLCLWAIDSEHFKFYVTELKKSDLEQQLAAYYRDLRAKGDLQTQNRALYDLLVLPAASEIKDKFVYIYPDKMLHACPFGALQNKQNVHFAFQTQFAFWNGFPLQPQQNLQQSLLIVHDEPHDQLQPLTKNMADHLQWLYDFTLTIENKDIVYDFADAALLPFDYIHLGPELQINPIALWQSGFAIGGSQLKINKLAGFSLPKMFSFQLANYAVLSMNLEQISPVQKGLSYTGLEFLYSLYNADKITDAVLFKRFYRYLAEGYSPAEALQQAQHYIFQNVDAHPFFWAGFKLCR